MEKTRSAEAAPARAVVVWLKNPEAIAAELGLDLYTNRNKRGAQLAEVRAMMGCRDFPAKDKGKGYWPRAAVAAWLANNVVVAKRERTFDLKDEGRVKNEESGDRDQRVKAGDLPAQAAPAEGELFADISPAEKFKARLLFNLDIYLNPHLHPTPSGGVQKLRGDEIQELRAAGLLPKVSLEPDGSAGDAHGINVTGGVRGVAGYINNNFAGVTVSHQSIHLWMKGSTLPPGCRENFPCPEGGGSNRWKRAEIDAWVNRYLRPSSVPGNALLVDDQTRQNRANADMAEMERDLMQRQLSTKYLEADLVLGFLEGFGAWLALQQDKFIEDPGTNCVRAIVRSALGAVLPDLAPAQLTILDTRLAQLLAAANDAMKLAAGHQAADLVAQLKKERADAVRQAHAA